MSKGEGHLHFTTVIYFPIIDHPKKKQKKGGITTFLSFSLLASEFLILCRITFIIPEL